MAAHGQDGGNGPNGDANIILEQLELLRTALQARTRGDSEPTVLTTVAERLAGAQTSLAACLEALNRHLTLRLIDPTQPADYTVTNVDQATLRQIWELVDAQRGAARQRPEQIGATNEMGGKPQ